jgi:nucleotide-binding universal stress UspA family protein
MGTIVVGVDGSGASIKALRYAVDEAKKTPGTEVKAVSAWHVPAGVYGSGWAPSDVDLDEFRKLAQTALDEGIATADIGASGVKVTPVLREGQPADVLCDEAEGSDLLVVGTRGLGGFHGLLVGSVSQQCVHHASVPVVVIRPDKGEKN